MSVSVTENNVYISEVMNYPEARSRICIRVLNYEHNRESVDEFPHIVEEDLAVVFCYLPEESAAQEHDLRRPQLITLHDLKNWEIDVFRLYRDAVITSVELRPPFLAPMRRLLGLPDEREEGEIPMYVLSCRDAQYGASVLFYPEVLSRIAEGLHDDIYIIPSSIHELILLRAGDVDDPESLRTMIRDINRTEVLPGDVLSDSLYYYDRGRDVLKRTV